MKPMMSSIARPQLLYGSVSLGAGGGAGAAEPAVPEEGGGEAL